jgi:hypothetical protein
MSSLLLNSIGICLPTSNTMYPARARDPS